MAYVSARCSERRYSRRAASATTSAGADLPRASAEAVDVARADADVAEHDGDVASAGSTREAAVAAGRGKGLLAFYADHHVVPLPAGHRFPMDKYRSTRLLLQSDASLDRILAVHPAPLVSWVELQQLLDAAIHTRALRAGAASAGLPLVAAPAAALTGLVRRHCSSHPRGADGAQAGAGVLAGGTHHAFRGHGEGFCVFNDIAVAALAALTHHPTVCNADRPILALDLDVHQGNGTASIFEGDPRVVTFSMHGANNYPWRSKRRSDYDVELPDDTGDAAYLSLLEQWLPKLFEHHRPSLVMFQAGVDALKEDSFGRLAMTRAGMLRRNNMVYSACIDNHVPCNPPRFVLASALASYNLVYISHCAPMAAAPPLTASPSKAASPCAGGEVAPAIPGMTLSPHKPTSAAAAATAEGPLSIVIFGASGDLAKKKTFPALFNLFQHGFLPAGEIRIFGYARSPMTAEQLREKIKGVPRAAVCVSHLTCSPPPQLPQAQGRHGPAQDPVADFLSVVEYIHGPYDGRDGYAKLQEAMLAFENTTAPTATTSDSTTGTTSDSSSGATRRLFYLALPPSVYPPVCAEVRRYCMNARGWTRVIVEKPFGRDLASAEALSGELGALFSEEQIYRIDHYLGKEVVQNLLGALFSEEQIYRIDHYLGKEVVHNLVRSMGGRGGRGWKEEGGRGGMGWEDVGYMVGCTWLCLELFVSALPSYASLAPSFPSHQPVGDALCQSLLRAAVERENVANVQVGGGCTHVTRAMRVSCDLCVHLIGATPLRSPTTRPCLHVPPFPTLVACLTTTTYLPISPLPLQIVFREDFGTEGRGGYFDQYGWGVPSPPPPLPLLCPLTRAPPTASCHSMWCFLSLQPCGASCHCSHVVLLISDSALLSFPSPRSFPLCSIIRDIIQNHLMQVRRPSWPLHRMPFSPAAPFSTREANFGASSISLPLLPYDTNSSCPLPPLFPLVLCLVAMEKPVSVLPEDIRDEKVLCLVAMEKPVSVQPEDIRTRRWAELAGRVCDAPAAIRSMYMKLTVKKPGLEMAATMSELDLSYSQRYSGVVIPEAYERLILDTHLPVFGMCFPSPMHPLASINGDQQHFVRRDELKAAWEIFTPLLHRIDQGALPPLPYKQGSRGPDHADELAERVGYRRTQGSRRKLRPSRREETRSGSAISAASAAHTSGNRGVAIPIAAPTAGSRLISSAVSAAPAASDLRAIHERGPWGEAGRGAGATRWGGGECRQGGCTGVTPGAVGSQGGIGLESRWHEGAALLLHTRRCHAQCIQ
ncbi:unnamed protein product [Closterium sp. NIES-64]|nr:unnamed protein product [Closterium sp. NIES-64]